MLKSKPVAENKLAQVAQDCRTPPERRSWADRRHSLPHLVKWLTHQAITCGLARMISPRATTTTIARRTTTTTAHRRICPVPIAEQPRPRFGAVTCAVRWFVTLADCTLNFMVLTDRIRCVAIQFTRADVVPRATSPTEEVSFW